MLRMLHSSFVWAGGRSRPFCYLSSMASCTRSTSTDSTQQKLVLGCGSNVVDHIYHVKALPSVGGKGFFLSPFKALEKKLIGGVTLNHLSWATLGGVPAGLLALQGIDELGLFIRCSLQKLGVSTEFVVTNSHYSTAQCHVFVQEDGERSIVMAPAATSLITAQVVREQFEGPIEQCASMLTTEISQVPFSGVLALLKAAKRAGVPSVLDVDVPPLVAINEARLGTMEELVECVRCADILKPSKLAAEGLLEVLSNSGRSTSLGLQGTAHELLRQCGSQLVAITNGGKSSILANEDYIVEVQPPKVEKVVDTTGAGDAFLGGLVAGLTMNGLPQSKEDLSNLATVANAFGAACVQTVGGVPTATSGDLLRGYLEGSSLHLAGSPAALNGASQHLKGFLSSLHKDQLAVSNVAQRINGETISSFMDHLEECQGQLLTSGIGKSGMVAQRFSGSLSSVGILSHYVHASEWLHGDLGKARPGRDIVTFFSHSGNTAECVLAATHLVARGITTLCITGHSESKLNKLCTGAVSYSSEGLQEPLGCVPTTSVILQELLCNAILCELIGRKGITKEVFRLNHPGGTIGIKLREKDV